MEQVILDKATRKRKAAKIWREIIARACGLNEYPQYGFGYQDVLTIAEALGVSITYESLRVKFDRYKNSLYLKKVGRGRFQVPPTGYYFFDLL